MRIFSLGNSGQTTIENFITALLKKRQANENKKASF